MWWSDPPGGHVCLSRPPMASGDFEYIFWDIPPLLGDPQTHFCLLRGPEPSKNPKMVKNVKNDWFWPKNGLKSGKKWVFRSHMASKLPEGCISTIWSDIIGIYTHFCLKNGYFWWKSSKMVKNHHFWRQKWVKMPISGSISLQIVEIHTPGDFEAIWDRNTHFLPLFRPFLGQNQSFLTFLGF